MTFFYSPISCYKVNILVRVVSEAIIGWIRQLTVVKYLFIFHVWNISLKSLYPQYHSFFMKSRIFHNYYAVWICKSDKTISVFGTGGQKTSGMLCVFNVRELYKTNRKMSSFWWLNWSRFFSKTFHDKEKVCIYKVVSHRKCLLN